MTFSWRHDTETSTETSTATETVVILESQILRPSRFDQIDWLADWAPAAPIPAAAELDRSGIQTEPSADSADLDIVLTARYHTTGDGTATAQDVANQLGTANYQPADNDYGIDEAFDLDLVDPLFQHTLRVRQPTNDAIIEHRGVTTIPNP